MTSIYKKIRKRIRKAKQRFKHEQKLYKRLFEYLKTSRYNALKYGKGRIAKMKHLNEEEKNRLFSLFVHDYDKYHCKFDEFYYNYHFPELSDKQKREYLTQREFMVIHKKYDLKYPKQASITVRKQRFLKEYAPFVHREWMYVDNDTQEEKIQSFINKFDVIVKPTNSHSGLGVYKLKRGEGSASTILKGKLPVLIEECIHNVSELAEFHPSSLNTIRVTTMTNGKNVKFIGADLRVGNNNSIFDNATSGGLYAEIDLDTGIVVSDGCTVFGETVPIHPGTGKTFKGSVIPRWNDVKSVCTEASLYKKGTYILAWDIAITENGIDLIEGNSAPYMLLHQFPKLKGIRKQFYGYMDDLHMRYKDALFYLTVFSWILHWRSPDKR